MMRACFRHLIRFGCLAAVAVIMMGCSGPQGRVFYVNSHPEGHGAGDEIADGVRDVLHKHRVPFEIFYMDTDPNADPNLVRQQTAEALRRIETYRPDVVIASDDLAVEHVLAPHFRNGPVPAVFCGVDGSAEKYGLPTPNVTGMLEIPPIRPAVEMLRPYVPQARRLVVVSENTALERRNRPMVIALFADMGLHAQYILVDTFAEWKHAFTAANAAADLIFLPVAGAIRDWDIDQAQRFVAETIRVPVFTCDDSMMPCCVFGLAGVAREQGMWAAGAAVQILRGTSPARIPVARNHQTQAWLNPRLAERVGFIPSPPLRERAHVVPAPDQPASP